MANDPAGIGEGGGFGGDGASILRGTGGRLYGALLARLEGGSGGGGAAAFKNPDGSIVSGGGGAGGGALELGAVGAILNVDPRVVRRGVFLLSSFKQTLGRLIGAGLRL
jgi:hypothetical protein